MHATDPPSEEGTAPTAAELANHVAEATDAVRESTVPDTTAHGLASLSEDARSELASDGYLSRETQAGLLTELAEALATVNRASVVCDNAPDNRDMTVGHDTYLVTRAEQREAFESLLSLMFALIDSPDETVADSSPDSSDE